MSHDEKVITEFCLNRLRSNLGVLFNAGNPIRIHLEEEIDKILDDWNNPDNLTDEDNDTPF